VAAGFNRNDCRRWRRRCVAMPLRIAPAEISFESENKRSCLPVGSCKDARDPTVGRCAGLGQHAVIEYLGPAPNAPEMTANE
jgi:hypothetical protein